MKDSLKAGIEKTGRIVVDKARTIDFMGDECRVYSTPQLTRDIEVLCRDFLLEHLDAGEHSVGARIELDHLAPTLLGMPVDLTTRVAEVKGRTVTFEVSAHDSLEPIARAKHVRVVVEVAAVAERLKRKRAKAEGAKRHERDKALFRSE